MKICTDCGEEVLDTIFIWFTNKDWQDMGMKPNDFLCDHCMVSRMREMFSKQGTKRWGLFINGNDVRHGDQSMRENPIDFSGGVGYTVTINETKPDYL